MTPTKRRKKKRPGYIPQLIRTQQSAQGLLYALRHTVTCHVEYNPNHCNTCTCAADLGCSECKAARVLIAYIKGGRRAARKATK